MTKKTHADVQALSDKLAPDLTIVDGKPVLAKTAYVGNLPEGLTEEHVKALHGYNSVFFPAVTDAFGKKAIVAMKEDKTIDKLFLEAPMYDRDHFDLTMHRSRTYPVPKKEGEASEEIVKFGVIVPSLHTHAAKGSRGEMHNVCTMLSEMALEAYGK